MTLKDIDRINPDILLVNRFADIMFILRMVWFPFAMLIALVFFGRLLVALLLVTQTVFLLISLFSLLEGVCANINICGVVKGCIVSLVGGA